MSYNIKRKKLYRSAPNISYKEVKDLVLNDKVTRRGNTIRKEEFSGSVSLETVRILEHSNIKRIGERAFKLCMSLQSVHIENDSITAFGREALRGCTSLRCIDIPDSVKAIYDRAFQGCTSLQLIKIPDGVATIHEYTFCGCKSLQSIHIPDSVKNIEQNAFRDCTSLQSINVPHGVTIIRNRTFYACSLLESIHIPNGVETVEWGAFEGCTSLKSVRIPNSVVEIGRSAFEYCRSLESIHIPDSVVMMAGRTFCKCSSLKSIHIPDGITTLGESAFECCTSLQSIHIPQGVKTIGRLSFLACTSLRSVHLPHSVEEVGRYAFEGCVSLQAIHIPKSLKTIEWRAFHGCKSLQSILIPKIAHISENAFDDCRLNQRQSNGLNFCPDTATYLRQRFDNLPIHWACYYVKGTQSRMDHFSALIQKSKRTLVAADAMGMTPLHILCCNLNATVAMVRILIENEPSLVAYPDTSENTPLELFVMCRSLSSPVHKRMPSLQDLFEKGITGEDLAILLVLDRNQEIDFSVESRDESTGLLPFMGAAISPTCGLDAVYMLAMMKPDLI